MIGQKKIWILSLIAVSLLLTLVFWEQKAQNDYLLKLQEEGLVFHTVNSPTNYYLDAQGNAVGLEADLAHDFSNYSGIPIRFQLHRTISDLLSAVQKDEFQVGAAGLTVTRTRENKYLFGPQYLSVRQQLVCPRRKEDLPIKVGAKTAYLDTLSKQFDSRLWSVVENQSTEQLLEQVGRRREFCTIADSTIVDLNRRYLPNLAVVESLGKTQPVAWALSPQSHSLRKWIRRWFIDLIKDNRLSEYIFRYYSFAKGPIDEFDIRVFHKRTRTRLPKYKKLFRKQASKYGFDWSILAAMAYQESHWNPEAKSHTGVRGLMMLTRNTASSVGVENRLDPAQSIHGGARYLKRLYQRFPKEMGPQDRLWMSLAAYNVGWGHLSDARLLTGRLGKNPDSWREVRQVLPFLADPDYYHDLPHGYARGQEPVDYVKRVRNYRDILQKIGS